MSDDKQEDLVDGILLGSSVEVKEGDSKGFTLESTHYFAVRKQGVLYVYQNRCPHLGIELEWQPDKFLDQSSSLIQCSTHGALFVIESGECISGPCMGAFLTPIRAKEAMGKIFIYHN